MGTDAARAGQVALGTEYTESFDVASKIIPELKGSLTVAMPNGRDLMRIGVIQHRLRDGVPIEQLDINTRLTVVMLSTLAVVVRKAPDWWYDIKRDGKQRETDRVPAPELVQDMDLLWDIYGRYVAFSDNFPNGRGNLGAGEAAAGAGAVASSTNPQNHAV
jgi:hypothetical protein